MADPQDDTDLDDELDDELDDTDDSDDEDDDDDDGPPAEPGSVRIGTVDLPDRMERSHYFKKCNYVELSALFGGPLKPGALAKWADVPGSVGLVAPFVLTHRHAPKAPRVWPHDTTSGDFRDSAPGRAALTEFAAAVRTVKASHAIFRSPSLYSASAANRDQLRKFFGEIATAEVVGATRVWIPDGLWDMRTAVTFATEIGVVCAIDPLVLDPGQPPEIFYDLDVSELYLRIAGLGHAGALRSERHEDLATLIESYEGVPVTVVFDSPQRWSDARNLKQALEAGM
jgi:hypothetical protein